MAELPQDLGDGGGMLYCGDGMRGCAELGNDGNSLYSEIIAINAINAISATNHWLYIKI